MYKCKSIFLLSVWIEGNSREKDRGGIKIGTYLDKINALYKTCDKKAGWCILHKDLTEIKQARNFWHLVQNSNIYGP